MKWIPLTLLLLCAATWLYVAAGARAQKALEVYRGDWQQEMQLAQQQAEAERRPVLWGRPEDCDAILRYRRVLQAAGRWAVPSPLYERVTEAAGKRPLPQAAGLLEEHRLALQELAEGTACTQASWQTDDLPQGQVRLLGALLVLDGDARLTQDPAAAAGRYLAAVRLGSDVAEASFALQGLVGGEVMEAGLNALVRLAGAAGETELRSRVGNALAIAESMVPGSAASLHRDRLQIAAVILAAGSEENAFAPVALSDLPRDATTGFFALVPVSLYWSRALYAVDNAFRAAEARGGDAARQTLAARLRQTAAAPWNPLLLQIAPNYLAALQQAERVAERCRQARAALVTP